MNFLKSFEDFEKWISEKAGRFDRASLILVLLIFSYGVLFSGITITRFYAFKTRAWDFGIFTQSLWTTMNGGKLFYYTCELMVNPTGSFFGVHFSPILFLILPFYAVFERPETLLVLQAFILALGAVPIYRLAKEKAGGRTVGLVFSSAYLLFPAVQFVNWYDFHVQAFLPLFFACMIYYATMESWPKYFAFVLLSLMCEEHVALIVFFFGIYLAWNYRKSLVSMVRRKEHTKLVLLIPFVTIALSVVWYWFTIWQRNTFFPTNPAALNEFLGSPNFTILGATDPLQIPYLVILRPLNAIQALVYDGPLKLLYLALLFGPLALFSFKAPSVLIPTIPWFGFSLLSQTAAHHVLGQQYEGYIIAFIFAAAIFGVRKNLVKQASSTNVNGSIKKIMVASIVFFVVFSPMCPLVQILYPEHFSIQIGMHEKLLQQIINLVPGNASILTQDNLFPQVSDRIDAYVVPDRWLDSSIRQLAINFVNATMGKVDYLLIDNKTDPVATALVISLLQNKPQFELIAAQDNNSIFLYERK
jgi:uncharacterized membrane protein